jgi:hypothetical protein
MSVAQRLDLAERLAGDFKRKPEALFAALEAWRDWWRDVLLMQAGADDGVANVDLLAELREDAAATGARRRGVRAGCRRSGAQPPGERPAAAGAETLPWRATRAGACAAEPPICAPPRLCYDAPCA